MVSKVATGVCKRCILEATTGDAAPTFRFRESNVTQTKFEPVLHIAD
jgi:hypothetical protein